ncbi:MAG TPA: GspE/PulE family protein [Gemmatimonas sp.]|nr:GspE/PulE family protein [Gemmatimonas sp.]
MTAAPRPESPGDARALRDAALGSLALRLPVRWLEEHAVLPLSEHADGSIVVAADGEPPALVADALRRVLGAPATFVQHSAGDIRAALLSSPRLLTGGGEHGAQRSGVTAAAGETGSALGVASGSDNGTESLDDLRALASREPVVQVVNAILAEAIRAGASDVHVESTAAGLRVRMRLDGVLHDAQQLGHGFQAAVLSRLKVLAGLDIAERRVPQDGRARVRVGDRDVDVRVSTLPALHGESIVMRLLDGAGLHSGAGGTRRLTDLGLSESMCGRLARMLARSSGLVLVTGPTGSGKTTTLYAALAERSTTGVKVVTVEDPVEYRLDGVVQLPVNPKAGFGFPTALRAILRHDPDVILVGEMRDVDTAEIAVQAALTGHLVLSTLHTTDATGALARLAEMGVPRYLIAATLHGVLAQRLVRTVCDGCAAWRDVTPEERALLGLRGGDATKRDSTSRNSTSRDATSRDASSATSDADAVSSIARVREGAGCTACAGTGYRGRAAIAELLVLDEVVRAQFVNDTSLDAMRSAVRARGVASLRDDGWRLVAQGQTTIAEVARVVSEDDGQ